MLQTMTTEHPQWAEFATRLSGPEGCNLTLDKDGQPTWKCNHDHAKARSILTAMGNIDIKESISYFEQNGGYCDCEILLNVDQDN